MTESLYLVFPNFNGYSMPLLVLVLQAYIFAGLLLHRYVKKKYVADLFLSLLIFALGHHCYAYIIGFMDWYDTYRTTKINYFFFDFSLGIGPLVYFYVKSITTPYFKFKRQDYWHFIPVVLFVVYGIFTGIYDAMQPGFDKVQNGYWEENINFKYVYPFVNVIEYYSLLLYYAFSIQRFIQYRKQLKHYFSNTYNLELNWLLSFLVVWTTLFLFHTTMEVINLAIMDLHWQQSYWNFIANALVGIFIGVKGYFTNVNQLYQITFEAKKDKVEAPKTIENQNYMNTWKGKIKSYMLHQKPHLNPDLTLSELAKQLNLGTKQLSQIINTAFNQNFKDFINSYRVEAVKTMLASDKQKELSLLGIAYECGFNSKATFNRTFKKFTNRTPSEFLAVR